MLEKISDIDKYLFIEKGLRGGICYIAKRCAKANNKYMNDYDPEKPSTFITYLDKNDLYGWTMNEYLPYGEFKWLENVHGFDVNSINEKSDAGYFLELILNILMNYMNYTMIIHFLQKNLLFLVICFQNIVKELLMSIKSSVGFVFRNETN